MKTVLLSLLIGAALLEAQTPTFKWWQDTDSLFLQIDSNACGATPSNTDIRADRFQWSCEGKLELDFALREDVVPEDSSCKAVGTARGATQLCSLKKVHPHHFDRLTTAAAAKSLKRYMKADWGRSTSSGPETPHNEAYLEEEDLVPTVSAAELEELKEDSVLVVADIMYSWCPSRGLGEKLLEAASKLRRKPKLKFVYVDPLENRELARSMNISCSDSKDGLYLFRQGEHAFALADTSQTPISSTVKAFLEPAATTLNSSEEYTEALKDSTVLVGFLEGASPEQQKHFRSAARKLLQRKPPIQSAVLHKDTAKAFPSGRTPPFAVLARAGAEPVVSDWEWTAAELFKFGKVFSAPGAMSSEEAQSEAEELGLPIAHVWPSQDGHQEARFTELVEKYRGKLSFINYTAAESYSMEEFGFGGKDLKQASGFGISNSLSYFDLVRYGFQGDDLRDPALEKFIEDYFQGKLKTSIKSQLAPKEPPVLGEVNVAVGSSLGALSKDKAVVLALYKPYAQSWKESEKVLESAAVLLKDVEGVIVAKLDTSGNGFDKSLFGEIVETHSNVLLYELSGGGSKARQLLDSADYTAGDTFRLMRDALLAKLKKRDDVAQHWAGIQAVIDKQDAEARQAAEARQKAEAEKYAAARVVQVTDGVTKYVFTEGDGAVPEPGDEVTAHYTGTLENGDKFDSSVDRNQPFVFTLGRGQVIGCWDQGFATMKPGEKADLKCSSDKAYGDRGSPPKIPPRATLFFAVELISFKSKSGKSEL